MFFDKPDVTNLNEFHFESDDRYWKSVELVTLGDIAFEYNQTSRDVDCTLEVLLHEYFRHTSEKLRGGQ